MTAGQTTLLISGPITLLINIALPAFVCGAASVFAFVFWGVRRVERAANGKPAAVADPAGGPPTLAEIELDADLALRDMQAARDALAVGDMGRMRHEFERGLERLADLQECLESWCGEAA
jgi:hypothetical protein